MGFGLAEAIRKREKRNWKIKEEKKNCEACWNNSK